MRIWLTAAIGSTLFMGASGQSAGPVADPGDRRAVEHTADSSLADLERARLAKKQASDEKSRSYLRAHLLYKNCEKELRPFCMMSAQMIMRTADARYRSRERQEFANIAALEAAVAGGEPPTKGWDGKAP